MDTAMILKGAKDRVGRLKLIQRHLSELEVEQSKGRISADDATFLRDLQDAVDEGWQALLRLRRIDGPHRAQLAISALEVAMTRSMDAPESDGPRTVRITVAMEPAPIGDVTGMRFDAVGALTSNVKYFQTVDPDGLGRIPIEKWIEALRRARTAAPRRRRGKRGGGQTIDDIVFELLHDAKLTDARDTRNMLKAVARQAANRMSSRTRRHP